MSNSSLQVDDHPCILKQSILICKGRTPFTLESEQGCSMHPFPENPYTPGMQIPSTYSLCVYGYHKYSWAELNVLHLKTSRDTALTLALIY